MWARFALPSGSVRPQAAPLHFQDVAGTPDVAFLQWGQRNQHVWRSFIRFEGSSRLCAARDQARRRMRSSRLHRQKRGCPASSNRSVRHATFADLHRTDCRTCFCEQQRDLGFDAKAGCTWARPYGDFGNLFRGWGEMDLRCPREQRPSLKESSATRAACGRRPSRPKTCSI